MFDFINTVDWADAWPYFAGVMLFGYLLGSIPFGLLITLVTGGGDIRKVGSGNIGATNVLRTGNRWAAAATLICDAGKGALAVLLVRAHYNDSMAVFAGFGAFLGHLFPVWLGFKGGKGVATFLGVTLALAWPVGLIAAATWIAAAAIWRISSLAALIAAALTPVAMMLLGNPLYALLTFLMAVLIFVMHRENIARILAGREPRIGAKR
ncbi:MAG TPA: glycerol-3-phosphate 1-O-acyltransferase PlsY [Rhizomicrobium sp.]|nr:glycerol-3-phosphate 1-O-acyltransferase PlsY [Rhizomicrobium sp.]